MLSFILHVSSDTTLIHPPTATLPPLLPRPTPLLSTRPLLPLPLPIRLLFPLLSRLLLLQVLRHEPFIRLLALFLRGPSFLHLLLPEREQFLHQVPRVLLLAAEHHRPLL